MYLAAFADIGMTREPGQALGLHYENTVPSVGVVFVTWQQGGFGPLLKLKLTVDTKAANGIGHFQGAGRPISNAFEPRTLCTLIGPRCCL